MKQRKIALKNLVLLTTLVSCFIACDKDFANLDSDIINNENATHFNINTIESPVIAYTKVLDPVQSNGLPLNMLGVYKDGIYNGTTTATIVSEIQSSILNPTFGNNVEIDSVILTIPYFSTPMSVEEDGSTLFELDSVFGSDPIKLSIFESNYFLRDFDPTGDANEVQNYYANMSTGQDMISPSQLEGTPILLDADEMTDLDNFTPSSMQIRLEDENGELSNRLAPALRLRLDKTYWQNKIIDKEGEPELSNTNNFNDYFRGIYFKAEPISDNGNLMLLNLASSNANITIYYQRDSPVEDSEDRVEGAFALTFGSTRVNFMSNDFTLPQGDDVNGDANLFLKGGQGSIAEIKLFNGENVDEDPTENTFEAFKNDFVETDSDGKFVRNKKIINEANLVFYVDQDMVGDAKEPERIYIYDAENNSPLPDYFLDNANTAFPNFSRIAHLGRLEKDDNDNGVKYKIRITEHINNLLLRDSTNVKLGLAVSGNVNLENSALQFDVLNADENQDEAVPVSSLVTPRGTVLYGNNTAIDEKRLYLEVIYTCQSTDNDCDDN